MNFIRFIPALLGIIVVNVASFDRFTHQNDPRSALIFTAGSSLGYDSHHPSGWAFYHGMTRSCQPTITYGRLETGDDPFNSDDREDSVRSRNRAELRATVAALRFVRFRHWAGESFNSLVIATDSLYAVNGAFRCSEYQEEADFKNKYLWDTLLAEIARVGEKGLTIYLWHIPSEWNVVATAAAKKAATDKNAPKQWTEVMGSSSKATLL